MYDVSSEVTPPLCHINRSVSCVKLLPLNVFLFLMGPTVFIGSSNTNAYSFWDKTNEPIKGHDMT